MILKNLIFLCFTFCLSVVASAQNQSNPVDTCINISGSYEILLEYTGDVPACSSGSGAIKMWTKYVQDQCLSLKASTVYKLQDGTFCENPSGDFWLRVSYGRLPNGTTYNSQADTKSIRIEFNSGSSSPNSTVIWKLNSQGDLLTNQFGGYAETFVRSPIQ